MQTHMVDVLQPIRQAPSGVKEVHGLPLRVVNTMLASQAVVVIMS